MKTYIVHLKRAKERGRHIIAQAKRHNLDFEIIEALDCRTLTDDDYARFCDLEAMRLYPNWLTPGLVCACYTHYLVYQKILEDNVDQALIVEDDVIFSTGINKLLDRIGEEMVSNEVILLHYLTLKSIRLEKASAVKLSDKFSLMDADTSEHTVSAAGYVVSREMAAELSDFVLPIRQGGDSWGRFFTEGPIERIRYVYPRPIESAGFKSTVRAAVQIKLRAQLTTYVDDNRIQPFFSIFRAFRKRSMKYRSSIIVE
jgi:glycosyl transferase, family 25